MKDKLKLYGGILLAVLIVLIILMALLGRKAGNSSSEIVYIPKKDKQKTGYILQIIKKK